MSATDIGLNFRASSGFVTDGTDETYVLAADAYPTTRGGWTFGWSSGATPSHLDRTNSIDQRLAGTAIENDPGRYFQVDLPSAGEYELRGAFGDITGTKDTHWLLKDNTTQFGAITGQATGGSADSWKDITDVVRDPDAAAWAANNAPLTRTFTSTVYRVECNGSANERITHLRIVGPADTGEFNAAWAVNSNVIINAGAIA